MTGMLLGKCLLLAGCSALGILRGMELRKRVVCLWDFCRTLSALSRELAFSLRPLPDLAARVQGEGPAGVFLACCRRRFQESGGENWGESWQRALKDCPLALNREDLALLEEAGRILGRWDGDSQRQAMEGLLARMEDSLTAARGEADRLFRVYAVLGITGGLFACLIL